MKRYIKSAKTSNKDLPVKIWMDTVNYAGEITDSTLIATFRTPNWAKKFIDSLPEYENSEWRIEGV